MLHVTVSKPKRRKRKEKRERERERGERKKELKKSSTIKRACCFYGELNF